MAVSCARVFCSYAAADVSYFAELELHLSMLQRDGCIDLWSYHKLAPGAPIDQTISDALEDADIVLLLISADFIASAQTYEVEMTRALELRESGQTTVLPILVRACEWQSSPFAVLQMLPRTGKPIALLDKPFRDEAWTGIASELRMMLGARRQAASLQKAPLSNLDDLLLAFLSRWPTWGFNVARIKNWGGRQEGFSEFAELSSHELSLSLRRLMAKGQIRTFHSKSGTELYKYSSK